MTTFILTCIIIIIFSIYLLIRNQYVYEWKIKLIHEIHEQLRKQITEDHSAVTIEYIKKRFKQTPSYSKMILMFWVWPLDKFNKNNNMENTDKKNK